MNDLLSEVNHAIRDGFMECDQSWRRYATIRPVRSFKPDNSPIEGKTLARMLTFTPLEVESGSWRQKAIILGRAAARAFLAAFWDEVERQGGPHADEGAGPRLMLANLDEAMADIDVDIAFIHGEQFPYCVVNTTTPEGEVEVRGFYDFGVTATKRIPAGAT